MPTRNGDFVRLTEEQIFQNLKQDLQQRLGASAEPGDLVTAQLRAEAKTRAQNQEQALQRIYYASYLEDATGKELDKVTDLIGISRREAASATGYVVFSRDTPPVSTHVIPRSSVVQTSGSEPTEFETKEKVFFDHIDGFEDADLANWTGDTADFSVVNTTTLSGNYALEVPTVEDATIIRQGEVYDIGTTFNFDINPSSGSVTSLIFGSQDSSNYHEAEINIPTGSITLNTVKSGSVDNSATKQVSVPTGQTSHVEVEWPVHGDLRLSVYESEEKNTLVGEIELGYTKTWTDGGVGFESGDPNATSLVDSLSTTSVSVPVESVDGGVQTNVGPDTITVMKSGGFGADEVNNPVPTGDTSYTDPNGEGFVPGQDREEDEELRERAFDNTSIGGSATVKAIGTALSNLPGVQSVKIFQNTEDTTVDGLPPSSFEPVINGGDDQEIASAIFDTKCIDSTIVGGVHGSEKSVTVQSDVLAQNETIKWSTPTEINLDITLDLIVDDTYVGDEEIKSLIVQYIGGTDVDGSFSTGLDTGEDLYEAVLKQEITDPDKTGVWEVNSMTIDSDGDGNDDTIEAANGADIFQTTSSEIVQVNARDDSITITTSQI